MENKQTAVELAIERLAELIPSGNQIAIYVIKVKAKEMEEEQYSQAYQEGYNDAINEIEERNN